jgi:hypothetical protein
MTSPDGITWTSRTSAADNSWVSVTYGNGLFIAISTSGTGNRVMTSPDGITWTSRTSATDNNWYSITYGSGLFVAISTSGTGNRVMTSGSPLAAASTAQITITSYTPSIIDLSKILVLRATSTLSTSTTPIEGTSYATSSTIGVATVVCSVSIAASTTHTCIDSGLINGTPYYYKIYTQDTSGNWSTGVEPFGNPISPGNKTVTLGTGTDTPSISLTPGGVATTLDTFTFQTSTSTDIISSVTLSLASSTATSTSLIEITNDAGSIVYGSVANPTTDTPTITLSNSTLTANTSLTQYRIRITPKSHANMPAVPGATYSLTARISGWVGTNAIQAGSDIGATTTILTIDNTSPSAPTPLSITKTASEQIIISYISSATSDAQDTIITRSLSNATDTPAEGTNYTSGNTIGASTVLCVASSSPLGGTKTCTFTNPVRSTSYYFKLFTKDLTGNYSLATSLLSSPFYIATPSSGRILSAEAEISNGATTTITGGSGNRGGGYGDTGTTTNATTTVSTTTPSKGGGGGDSGFIYNGSNLASVFQKAFSFFLGQTVTGGTETTYANEPVPASVPQGIRACSLQFLGVCVVNNLPWHAK